MSMLLNKRDCNNKEINDVSGIAILSPLWVERNCAQCL